MIHRNTTHPGDNGLPDEECPTCDSSLVPAGSFVVHDMAGSVLDQEFKTLESAEAWVRHLTECRPDARPVVRLIDESEASE